MKNILLTLATVITITGLSTSSTASSHKAPDRVIMSPCMSPIKWEVKQGMRLKPSNQCRVVNYYTGSEWVGARKIPVAVAYEIPWYPKGGVID